MTQIISKLQNHFLFVYRSVYSRTLASRKPCFKIWQILKWPSITYAKEDLRQVIISFNQRKAASTLIRYKNVMLQLYLELFCRIKYIFWWGDIYFGQIWIDVTVEFRSNFISCPLSFIRNLIINQAGSFLKKSFW